MDWGHFALGGVIVLIVLVRGFTRRRRRSIEWTFRWEEEHDDKSDG